MQNSPDKGAFDRLSGAVEAEGGAERGGWEERAKRPEVGNIRSLGASLFAPRIDWKTPAMLLELFGASL